MSIKLFHSQNKSQLDPARWNSARIIFDGNSLTDDDQGSRGGTGYPEYMMLLEPWASNGTTKYNFGVGGQKIRDMNSDAAGQIDTLFGGGSMKKVCFYWEVGNELYYHGDDVDCYNRIVSYGQARQAAGWITVAVLDTRRDGPEANPDAYATWALFNADGENVANSMRTNQATFCDYLLDIRDHPDFDDPLGTYFIDGTHHTVAGRQKLGDIFSDFLLNVVE